MISECIYKSKLIFMTSKNENYLDSYLSHFYIKDQNETILFFSHGKIKFYKTDEFENQNKFLIEQMFDIKSIYNHAKDLLNVGNVFDYILIDRIDILLEDKNKKERIGILDDLFLLATEFNTQIIFSLVNHDEPSLLIKNLYKFDDCFNDLIDVENINKDFVSLVLYHHKSSEKIKEKINIGLTDELKNKKDYFHIGVKGLTKEINFDHFVLLLGRPSSYKTTFILDCTFGSLINNNKTLLFTLGRSKNTIINYLKNKDEAIYTFYSKYLLINDHLLSFNELYNYILDSEDKLCGIDVVLIDSIDDVLKYESKEKQNYFYHMLYRLAIDLNIHFIISKNTERGKEKLDDKYLVFDKVIKISKHEDNRIKLTFSQKENGEFIEYLDLVKGG